MDADTKALIDAAYELAKKKLIPYEQDRIAAENKANAEHRAVCNEDNEEELIPKHNANIRAIYKKYYDAFERIMAEYRIVKDQILRMSSAI